MRKRWLRKLKMEPYFGIFRSENYYKIQSQLCIIIKVINHLKSASNEKLLQVNFVYLYFVHFFK